MTDFYKLRDQLAAELDALNKKAAPVRAELDALKEKIAPVEAEIRVLHNELKEIEQPHKAELQMKLAAVEEVISKFPKAEDTQPEKIATK